MGHWFIIEQAKKEKTKSFLENLSATRESSEVDESTV